MDFFFFVTDWWCMETCWGRQIRKKKDRKWSHKHTPSLSLWLLPFSSHTVSNSFWCFLVCCVPLVDVPKTIWITASMLCSIHTLFISQIKSMLILYWSLFLMTFYLIHQKLWQYFNISLLEQYPAQVRKPPPIRQKINLKVTSWHTNPYLFDLWM